jgi:uncharacterized iron-regulated membrane protein
MLRKLIFWPHLFVGLATGIVVFLLCLTGAILAFERQIIDWAESDARALPPEGTAEPLPTGDLVAVASKANPAKVTTVIYRDDPRVPVRVTFADRTVVCVNAYTGEVLGDGSPAVRGFMAFTRRLHTGLALPGNWGEHTGGMIVGACNVGFVFLAVSGLYLWWPRKWRWAVVRNSLVPRLRLRGKARDWNWHNALGFWALVPLLVMTLSGVVLSYGAVNTFLKESAPRLVAETVPPETAPVATTSPGRKGWPGVLAAGEAVPGRRTLVIHWGSAKPEKATVVVHPGLDGEAHRSAFLTVNPAGGSIVQVRRWENRDPAERVRAVVRNIHSGELGGVPGQVVALLGCLAGCVLVYTGFALSVRRFAPRGGGATTDKPTPTGS